MVDLPPEKDPAPDALASLEARIERLERIVDRLAETRGAGAGSPVPPEPPPGPRTGGGREGSGEGRPPPPPPPRARGRSSTDWLRLGEDWLGRVGVLLLLLGLAFLYRYAIDRGWITPSLRVGFGILVGGTLLYLGLTRSRLRPRYSQILLGGAVAVLYLTGWAAEVLYGLVPWSVGFSWMAMVTVLALALAERRDHQLLAVIGAGGGLATPFLLEAATESPTGLVVYVSLVLGWAGLLQLRRGWGILLTVNVVGGMVAMGASVGVATGIERLSVQGGIVVAWAVACAFPHIQGWLHARQPDIWPPPPVPGGTRVGPGSRRSGRVLLWGLGVGVSALAALLALGLWDLWGDRVSAGVVFLVVAGALVSGSRLLREARNVSQPAFGSGAVLILVGTALVAGREGLPVPLALEAVILSWIAGRDDFPALAGLGHGVFLLLALDFLTHLAGPADRVLDLYALGVLVAMGVAAGAAARLPRLRPAAAVYHLVGYAAFLAWVAWRLVLLPGGQGAVSASWGACAVVLLVLGARTGHVGTRMTGLATLAAVAAKLLLVDLSALDPALRILLFLGFGALFLALGWAFKGRDR